MGCLCGVRVCSCLWLVAGHCLSGCASCGWKKRNKMLDASRRGGPAIGRSTQCARECIQCMYRVIVHCLNAILHACMAAFTIVVYITLVIYNVTYSIYVRYAFSIPAYYMICPAELSSCTKRVLFARLHPRSS